MAKKFKLKGKHLLAPGVGNEVTLYPVTVADNVTIQKDGTLYSIQEAVNQGVIGKDGKDGKDGTNGVDGLQGPKGDTVVVSSTGTYKLYNATGSNTDGAMTQNATTQALTYVQGIAQNITKDSNNDIKLTTNPSSSSNVSYLTETQTRALLQTKANQSDVLEYLDDKVGIGDYDPSLRAGVADTAYDVIADNTETETFTSRVVGNTSSGHAITKGNASVKVMKGNSVVWNQLFICTEHPSYSVYFTPITEGYVKINGSQTSREFPSVSNAIYFDTSHKYLFFSNRVSGSISNDGVSVNIYEKFRITFGIGQSFVGSPLSNGNMLIGITTTSDVTYTDYVIGIQCIDLTKMFNGNTAIINSITNYETFIKYAHIVQNPYAYNEGTLISNNATAIRTIGKNLWDEEWELGSWNNNGEKVTTQSNIRSKNKFEIQPNKTYYFRGINVDSYLCFFDSNKNIIGSRIQIQQSNPSFSSPSNAFYLSFVMGGSYGNTYKHDICINVSDTSFNGTYEPYKKVERPTLIKSIKDSQGNVVFPNGLLFDGTNRDYIDYRRGKADKKVGSVDLGSLNYEPSGYSNIWYSNEDVNFKSGTSNGIASNGEKVESASGHAYFYDCIMLGGNSLGGEHKRYKIVIYGAFDNASAVKSAMNNVMLQYELATPIEYTFDPSHLDYPIVNGGVEELVAEGNVAPIVADITYPCSANGTIDAILERVGMVEDASGKIVSLSPTIQAYQILFADKWNISADKVGVVDLGTLVYSFDDDNPIGRFISSSLTDNKTGNLANYFCVKFKGNASAVAKTEPWLVGGYSGSKYIYLSVPKGTYSNVTSFNDAMKGIYLFYEKA